LIAHPEDAPAVRLELSERELATETEAELGDDLEAIPGKLVDLRTNYRVQSEGNRGRLVRRGSDGD
jgi:hypothetical protein